MSKYILAKVLGSNPSSKILEVFILNKNNELTMTDIIRGASVGAEQAYTVMRRLLSYGIVCKTKKIGNYQLYQINKQNKSAKLLIKLFYSFGRQSDK